MSSANFAAAASGAMEGVIVGEVIESRNGLRDISDKFGLLSGKRGTSDGCNEGETRRNGLFVLRLGVSDNVCATKSAGRCRLDSAAYRIYVSLGKARAKLYNSTELEAQKYKIRNKKGLV